MSANQSHIFIISSPSGGGKTSLARAVVENIDKTALSISYTTRAQRPQEENGQDYHFVSIKDFQTLMQKKAFVEYAEVFGHWYGSAKLPIERALGKGEDVILDIDWQGAREVKKHYPEAVRIFLLPPSKKVLAERLTKRQRDSQEAISARMIQAQAEMSHYDEYDYLIVNDVFEIALTQACAIIQAKRIEVSKQQLKLKRILESLLGK